MGKLKALPNRLTSLKPGLGALPPVERSIRTARQEGRRAGPGECCERRSPVRSDGPTYAEGGHVSDNLVDGVS
jgi:hypothetical protein